MNPPPTIASDAAIEVTPPSPGDIGAMIRGLDLRDLDAARAAEIRALVYEHKLVVFRDQHLSTSEYVAASRVLGTPQIYFQDNYLHPDHPEVFVSSNREMNGKKVGVAGTGRYWHTDYQFFEEPLPLTMVYPQELPSSRRETYYIDMERVQRELPAELRAFTDGTRARHEARWRYKIQPTDVDKSITEILAEFGAETPPVTHPTVITHPVNGRELLYVSRGFTVGIEGLSYEDGWRALRRLFEFVERPEHVHRHAWGAADILLWDNRQVIHMASTVAPGEPSVSFRIGVYDGLPFYTGGEPATLLGPEVECR
jgi:taurine dioxygenase